MKKVIILGAGPLQLPAIKALKDFGCYVYAFDYDKNAVGFKYCDECRLISTVDRDAVLAEAKKIKPDFVLTSTSDAPVQVAAFVSEQLGLFTGISYEDSVCATEKWAMRKRLAENGVPIPSFHSCKNEKEYELAVKSFNYVCVVKPSDSAASRGVYFVSSKKEAEEAYDNALAYSRNKIVMVEEYMRGPEVSVECLVHNENVQIIAVTDKLVTQLPFFVELGHSEPSSLPFDTQEIIKKVAAKAIKAIGIKNGVSHVEIKVTKDGPKIVELAARLGGDYITSMLVPLSTGYDMVKNSVRLALNLPPEKFINANRASAIRFLYGPKGVIKRIHLDGTVNAMPNIVDCKLYKKEGDLSSELKSSNDRLGHVVARGNNLNEAINACDNALRMISVEVEQSEPTIGGKKHEKTTA